MSQNSSQTGKHPPPRHTHPRKEGNSSKGRSLGPQSLHASRRSYWDVSSLLENSTGEGPVPLNGLAPTQESPLCSQHTGARGMELNRGLGQTCKRAQKTDGGGRGAEVVQCTTEAASPASVDAGGWQSICCLREECRGARPSLLPRCPLRIATHTQGQGPLPSQTPRQKPCQTMYGFFSPSPKRKTKQSGPSAINPWQAGVSRPPGVGGERLQRRDRSVMETPKIRGYRTLVKLGQVERHGDSSREVRNRRQGGPRDAPNAYL